MYSTTLIAWSGFNPHPSHVVLRPWIGRFTMIICACWFRTISKFVWKVVKRQPESPGLSTPHRVRTIRSTKSATVAFSWVENKYGSVKQRNHGVMILRFLGNGNIMQGSQTIQLPYRDPDTGAVFRRLSSTFLTMATNAGIDVIWDGNHRIYIRLTPSHKNKVRNGFKATRLSLHSNFTEMFADLQKNKKCKFYMKQANCVT